MYRRNAAFIWDYLAIHPCVDCGLSNPRLLEFDHVSGEKAFGLATAGSRGYSRETIKAEIAKCDIRCANCHRLVSGIRRGWWRWADLAPMPPALVSRGGDGGTPCSLDAAEAPRITGVVRLKYLEHSVEWRERTAPPSGR